MKKHSRNITRFIGLICTVLVLTSGSAMAAPDTGYQLTSELWAKAVLQVATNPVTQVTLVWKEVGSDTTSTGDRVVSGYFYADPADFAYGSQYNPEVFVKVYIAANGWANMAFNHVTVDPVEIHSAHNYTGAAQKTATATTLSRLVQHEYTGVGTGGQSQSTSATGDWTGTWTSIDGYSNSATTNITQSGNSLSGTMTVYGTDCGTYSNVPVTGTYDGGNAYSFSVSTTCGSDSVHLVFSGQISGDTMTGTYKNYINGSYLYDSGTFSVSR